jgi:signal transduction histidine kinase
MDELKNDLVATVAHEVRTPLTSLRMGIHLVLEEAAGPVTEKQADLLTAAREDCERLQTIVDELLDLSRIQSGRLDLLRARVSIDELVHAAIDATRAAAAERDVELRAELLPGLADVDVDRERAELVLGNLVGNAVRHTPAHAPVVVRVLDEEHVLRIEVLDHGPGVPLEEQSVIFEKHAQLETGKKGSAGLGLFIVKEIVEAHGGTVGVTSDGVHGSTFWFTLPKFVDVEPTS